MIYTVLVDILVVLWHNKYNLLSLTVAINVGLIIGKRWGIRFAINYLMRVMGLSKKEINLYALAAQVQHHEEQIVKGGTEPWVAESKQLGKRTIGLKLPSGLRMKFLAPIATRFTRQQVTEKSTYSRRKNMREYLKKLGSRKFKAFIIITVTNILMLIGYIMNVEGIQDIADGWMPAINLGAQLVSTVVYQMVEGRIDAKREEAKPFILGGSNDPDYSKADSTSE